MKETQKTVLVSALALMLIAAVVTAALALTNALTADTIAARTAETENAARLQVMEADSFEAASVTVQEKEVTYYIAKKDGATVGYVFTAVTNGKSSGLTVMTGIGTDGKLTGVTVTDDNETAGYVDKVTKGGLLEKLVGREAQEMKLNTDVDAVSQATKTSGGILKGVNQAIAWFHAVQEVNG